MRVRTRAQALILLVLSLALPCCTLPEFSAGVAAVPFDIAEEVEARHGCGGQACTAHESCELHNFQETCVCGTEGPCSSGSSCWKYDTGKLSCVPPILAGGAGCSWEKSCEWGAMCITQTDGGPPACQTLCDTDDIFCDNGAYCIGLLSPPTYFYPLDGVCNVNGKTSVGGSCSTAGDCKANLFCILKYGSTTQGICRYPCDLWNPKCPSAYQCEKLTGGGKVGACY